MKVVFAPIERLISPFGEPGRQAQILGRDLHVYALEELDALGFEVVSEPPDEPYLLISDRTWFTRRTLERLLEQATAPARLRCDHPDWLELTAPLQEHPEPGVYEIALLPAGAPASFDGVPAVTIDLNIETTEGTAPHPAMAHAMPERTPFTDAPVYQIDHWMHILHANWMAMAATMARERRTFAADNVFVKVWKLLGILFRMRSLSKAGLMRALSRVGKGCDIHPTAILEATVIGDNCTVGPFAVVRGSVLQDGAVVEEHGIVNATVMGAGSKVGRRAMQNFSVLYPGAMVSVGHGHQACLFGRDSFVAMAVTMYDLAFDKHIRVLKDGEKVSSGKWFLGIALGHGSKLGAHVQLGYGAEVPNDVFVVGPSAHVMRRFEPGEGPFRVGEDGVARSLK